MKKMLLATCIGFFAMGGVALADAGKPCKKIHYKPFRTYEIKSKMHMGTHIILPEMMIGDPIAGNQILWTVEGVNNHIFIKPTTDAKEGAKTTVTAVSRANNSYEFIVTAVEEGEPDTCIEVVSKKAMLEGSGLSQYKSPEEVRNIALERQVSLLSRQAEIQRLKGQQDIEEALQKYRTYIYTRYTWEKTKGSFMGEEVISDVYDDGRFTYIRLLADNKGLLTISALIDDEEEFIEYKYDDENDIYRIAGIFPNFDLKYRDFNLRITRENSKTKGAY